MWLLLHTGREEAGLPKMESGAWWRAKEWAPKAQVLVPWTMDVTRDR